MIRWRQSAQHRFQPLQELGPLGFRKYGFYAVKLRFSLELRAGVDAEDRHRQPGHQLL